MEEDELVQEKEQWDIQRGRDRLEREFYMSRIVDSMLSFHCSDRPFSSIINVNDTAYAGSLNGSAIVLRCRRDLIMRGWIQIFHDFKFAFFEEASCKKQSVRAVKALIGTEQSWTHVGFSNGALHGRFTAV